MIGRRAVALAAAATTLAAGAATAQRVDTRRAATFVVGAPAGAAPMARVDGQRTARAADALPSAPLRVVWKKMIAQGRGLDAAPLVTAGGEIVVATSGGEAVWVGADGAETNRLQLATAAPGEPASLSDGTLVVVGASAEAIGFRRDGVRFRTRLGGDRSLTGKVAPLPLADGGVVVATSTQLSLLDAEGAVRARAVASEPLVTALLAARGQVIAIGATGTVYGWQPGRELVRVGALGGEVDGGAALLGDHTLIAMVDAHLGSRVVSLNLDTAVTSVRATSPGGAYLGPPALSGNLVYGLAAAAGRSYVIALDDAGLERLRSPIPVNPSIPVALADGGAAAFVPPHAGVVVDASGAVAFASPEGVIGVVDATGALSTLQEAALCGRPGKGMQVAGIAPAGPGAFVVACGSGLVARIASRD